MVTEKQIWAALEEVMDPEIPTISLVDLGIVTSVNLNDGNEVEITLIPTFSGCPALKVMEEMVAEKVKALGAAQVSVTTNFDIPWTTNRISEKGRKGLLKHGLAPPPDDYDGIIELSVLSNIVCPYCQSKNTRLTTPFGPTLCRSMHYCDNCLQAFEQFKPVG